MSVATRLGPYISHSARPLVVSRRGQSAARLDGHCDLIRPGSTRFGRHRTPKGRRNFSVLPVLESAINHAEQLTVALHQATGTPWYLTIPLVALSINLLARLPLTLYTQRLHQRRAKLAPLLQTWHVRHSKQVAAQPRMAEEEFRREVASRFGKTSKRLYRAFGVQGWKAYGSLASFPVWLTGIEALRRMCGGPRGLLGNLVFGQKEDGLAGTEAGAAAAPSAASDSFTSDPLGAAPGVDAITHTDGSMSAGLSGSLLPGTDPSLATGGCLWFPDLMAPDPLHILPFLLSAVLALNVLPRSATGLRALFSLQPQTDKGAPGSATSPTTTVLATGRTRLQRALLGVALVVGPVTMDLPAALHVYWLASATITYIQTEAIGHFVKIPDARVRRCTGVDS